MATKFAGFREFKELSKSGIIFLVALTAIGGYFMGAPMESSFRWGHFIFSIVAISLLAAGSSALNQIQDAELDSKMPRTAKRPLPSGRLLLSQAWAFAGVMIALGLAGLAWLGTDLLGLGLGALLTYNLLYTLWWKRQWAFAAVPGAIPGALPTLMGYAAAAGYNAWPMPQGIYLFTIVFFWQMPHFWVLALKYEKDYRAGGIPTLSVSRGAEVTTFQIQLWTLAYAGLALLAPLFLRVSSVYLVFTIPLCLKLLFELVRYSRNPGSKNWLRFFLWVNFSLIILLFAAVIDRWHWIWFSRFLAGV